MIVPILLHVCIGLGALGCQTCGRYFCRHRRIMRFSMIAVLMLAEATVSVLVIDRFFE